MMTISELNKHGAAVQKAFTLIRPDEVHYNLRGTYFGDFSVAQACDILRRWSESSTYENVTLVGTVNYEECVRCVNGNTLILPAES